MSLGRLNEGFRIKIRRTGSNKFRRNPSDYLGDKIFPLMEKQIKDKEEINEVSECSVH
jgi:hypothetical protein